ncbi:MAG: protein kinase [Candidatus Delongbacteria bacterium]|nr:protein kinase [Candidatus Delongbacteria bacterium]
MDLINQRYEINQILGQGGFGSVYKVADHFENGKVLALKKIKKEILSKKAINVFKHEFKFLISLIHPNLVKVHDFDIDKDTDELFFTMEYIQGNSLFRSLKESFSWEKVENNLIQACRALSYIHSKDIIHYDIKPDNIFIDSYGKLKIMDFGFAGGKNTTEVRGTMQFIAPELLLKKNVTHKIDFFSLGVTFYFSITGKLPFKGKDRQEIISNSIKGNYIPLENIRKGVPEKLARVIARMMQPDQDKRYESADDIIIDLIDDPDKKKNLTAQYLFTDLGIRSYISSGKLIGRKKELSFMLSNSSKVFEEKVFFDNKPIFLVGRYGNGKSSILREYKYLIQLNEGIDYYTANFVRGDETKYQAFEIIIQEMFRLHRLNVESYPNLRFLFKHSDEPETADDSAQAKIQKLGEIDAMVDFFCSFSRKFKFVLELKDFDNANSSSINLFENLTREMRRSPEKEMAFMVVSTVQTENLKSYHKITLKRMRDQIHRLEINPLAISETKEYVNQLLTDTAIQDEIIGFMHRFTGGVPYYINELLIYLFNQSYLSRSQMKWSLDPGFLNDLNLGLRDITYSNFKRFSNIEQALIKELMILARPTPFEMMGTISKVTKINNQIAVKFLYKLTDSEMIEKIKYFDGYRYYLTKKLFLNAVMKDFPKDDYLSWNLITAEEIEKKYGVNNDNVYALTDYYFRSPNKAKAIEMLEMSINKSFDENNLEFAVTNLKRLYGIETDPSKKVNIFVSIIQNQTILGNYDNVLDQLVRFENEENTVSEINKLRIKLVKYECSSKAGRFDYLDETRTWLINFKIKSSLPKEIKASYYMWLGGYYTNDGKYKKALKFYNKALKIYQKDARELLSARTILKISSVKLLKGDLRRVLDDVKYSLEIFRKYNETEDVLEGYITLGDVYSNLPDRDNAIQYYGECNALAKDQNNIVYEVESSHKLSGFKIKSLNFNDALNLINCGVEKPEDVNITDLTGDIYYHRAKLFYQTGKLNEAILSVNKAIDIQLLLKRYAKLNNSLLMKCKIQLRQYKPDEAQKTLEITKLYSSKENVRFLINHSIIEALIFHSQEKYKKAVKQLKKIDKSVEKISTLEEKISYRVLKAMIFEKLKDMNQTMGTLGYAYAIYDRNSSLLEHNKLLNLKLMIYYNKIRCYSGDQDNGIKELSNIIQYLGNHELPYYKAFANYNLGKIYLDAEEKYRAIACYRSAKKEFEKLSTDYPEYKTVSSVIEQDEKEQDKRM